MKRTPKDPKEIYAGQDADVFGKAQRGLVKMKGSRRGQGDQSEAHKEFKVIGLPFAPSQWQCDGFAAATKQGALHSVIIMRT